MILGFGDKVYQEFYCRHCPADDPNSADPEKQKTGGHFRVKFSLGYDASIKIHCPKCKHVHERHVQNGVLKDGSGPTRNTDEVRVPLSAWSRDPYTRKGETAKATAKPHDTYLMPIRGDNVIAGPDDLSTAAKAAIKNRAAAQKGGVVLKLHDPERESDGADGAAGANGDENH